VSRLASRAMDALIWLLSRRAAPRLDPPALTAEERFDRQAREHTDVPARLRRALGKED